MLIVLGSLVGVSYAMMERSYFWGMGGMMYGGYNGFMNGMMGYYYYNNSYPVGFYSMMTGIEIIGPVSGVLVLAFALFKSRPSNLKIYGILALVFSIASLFGNGGFFIGAILGIVGGVLALI
jgi:predicted benzoate:H+ symporter BenE